MCKPRSWPTWRKLWGVAPWERHLIGLSGLKRVSLIVQHIEPVQEFEVFFLERCAAMMLLLILNVSNDRI